VKRRPGRWWAPAAGNVRPGQRSRVRARRLTDREAEELFESGYRAGEADERQRYEQQRDVLRRLADASTPGDLAAVARDAGVPVDDDLAAAEAGQLVDELEAWRRGQR
jgi:hypothetical protein